MSLPDYYITDMSVVRHGVVRLTFADGLSGEVDLLDHLWGPVFERARSAEGFTEVFLDSEIGTIAWPNGADFAPDTLYERVKTGSWPGTPVPVRATDRTRT